MSSVRAAATSEVEVQHAARRLHHHCILNKREAVLIEALAFEAFEVRLHEGVLFSDVIAACFQELWEDERAADWAVGRNISLVFAAVQPLFVAAGFVNLCHVTVERVPVAQDAALPRRIPAAHDHQQFIHTPP
jgi:hypothetical protein